MSANIILAIGNAISERQTWGRWLSIDNYRRYSSLSSLFKDFTGDNILGYVYIDHTVGVTLEVVRLFNWNGNKFEWVDDPFEKGIRIIIRYSQYKEIPFQIKEDRLLSQYQISVPVYLKEYEMENLAAFRASEVFDEFRAEGFPDDIQILLVPDRQNTKPELVWGRVEDYDGVVNEDNATLLVQPKQKVGINVSNNIPFSIMKVQNRLWPVCVVKLWLTKDQPKKPWWKVW